MAFSSSQSSLDLINSQSTFKNYLLSQVDGDNSSVSFTTTSGNSDRQLNSNSRNKHRHRNHNDLKGIKENEKLLLQYENKLNKIYKKKSNQREITKMSSASKKKQTNQKSVPIK